MDGALPAGIWLGASGTARVFNMGWGATPILEIEEVAVKGTEDGSINALMSFYIIKYGYKRSKYA